MTGSGPLWRKANPFAAPSAILILLDHGSGIFPSKIFEQKHQPFCLLQQTIKWKTIFTSTMISPSTSTSRRNRRPYQEGEEKGQ